MGKWRKGSCLVLSKKIVQREKTTDDTDGVYLVTHRVNITLGGEDGAEVIEGVRAWKAPAWALGPKELDHGNVSTQHFMEQYFFTMALLVHHEGPHIFGRRGGEHGTRKNRRKSMLRNI